MAKVLRFMGPVNPLLQEAWTQRSDMDALIEKREGMSITNFSLKREKSSSTGRVRVLADLLTDHSQLVEEWLFLSEIVTYQRPILITSI